MYAKCKEDIINTKQNVNSAAKLTFNLIKKLALCILKSLKETKYITYITNI